MVSGTSGGSETCCLKTLIQIILPVKAFAYHSFCRMCGVTTFGDASPS
jgi:hypothetical protein